MGSLTKAEIRDIDPECLELINAINEFPGIQTTGSCSGHGKEKYRIRFIARDMESLSLVSFWFVRQYSLSPRWIVRVVLQYPYPSLPSFEIEGPPGAYDEALKIAHEIIKIKWLGLSKYDEPIRKKEWEKEKKRYEEETGRTYGTNS